MCVSGVGVGREVGHRKQGRFLGGMHTSEEVGFVCFKVQCVHESPGNLVKMQILTQGYEAGTEILHF